MGSGARTLGPSGFSSATTGRSSRIGSGCPNLSGLGVVIGLRNPSSPLSDRSRADDCARVKPLTAFDRREGPQALGIRPCQPEADQGILWVVHLSERSWIEAHGRVQPPTGAKIETLPVELSLGTGNSHWVCPSLDGLSRHSVVMATLSLPGLTALPPGGVSDRISRRSRNCTCLVPCRRVRYEPSLSYAQLSHINVERFIVTSEQKRRKLEVCVQCACV